MSRAPSDKTLLRHAKARVVATIDELGRLKVELHQYRQRASKAEAEAAEWKKRFDILLSREVPQSDGSGDA